MNSKGLAALPIVLIVLGAMLVFGLMQNGSTEREKQQQEEFR